MQPMIDPDTGSIVVFNGEVYIYRALRHELEGAGVCFRDHSGTEALLKPHAAHGREKLTELRSLFASVLWDARHQMLFLTRDSSDTKRLYLADDGKTLRFASQVKALLAGGANKTINIRPEPAGQVGFFLLGHVPEPYTPYKGIRALRAGTTLRVDRGDRRKQET